MKQKAPPKWPDFLNQPTVFCCRDVFTKKFPKYSAIYFVIKSTGELTYIGKTKCLH